MTYITDTVPVGCYSYGIKVTYNEKILTVLSLLAKADLSYVKLLCASL